MPKTCNICHRRLEVKPHKHDKVKYYICGLTPPPTPSSQVASQRNEVPRFNFCSGMYQEEKNDPDVSNSSSSEEEEEELSVSSTETGEEVERTPLAKKRKAIQAKTPKPKRSPIEDKKYLREMLEKYQRDLESTRKKLEKKVRKVDEMRKDISKKSEKIDLMTIMTEDFLYQLNEEEQEGITEHIVS